MAGVYLTKARESLWQKNMVDPWNHVGIISWLQILGCDKLASSLPCDILCSTKEQKYMAGFYCTLFNKWYRVYLFLYKGFWCWIVEKFKEEL